LKNGAAKEYLSRTSCGNTKFSSKKFSWNKSLKYYWGEVESKELKNGYCKIPLLLAPERGKRLTHEKDINQHNPHAIHNEKWRPLKNLNNVCLKNEIHKKERLKNEDHKMDLSIACLFLR
jgi:hypothetical protein